MPKLLLGPLLRYVGETDATVWVEADSPCEVEVLGRRRRTFGVAGHHYALVQLEGLEPGSVTPYQVVLDGEPAWPLEDSEYPESVIRTIDPDGPITLSFGSCRVCAPHAAPFSLTKEEDPLGFELDALYALATRMASQGPSERPDALVMLGDQVYADEISPQVREFIRARRDPNEPPGEQIADFEEYTRLYWESWCEPYVRWLLSTLSTAMIFDDHDVHDDWNTSQAWIDEIRAQPWWDKRIIGGFVSYWIYQHIGNLSPRELNEDGLYQEVKEADDAWPLLEAFARRADRESEGSRWSFHRDLGRTRLVMMDSRAGRVLEGPARAMVDDDEWRWIAEHAAGDFDHLLLGTSLPYLLAPGMHHLEAWNEAVCEGAWGSRAAELAERMRQGLDLEHWAAFGNSFARLTDLVREVGAGGKGRAPASIVALSGDVHHAYLAEVAFRRGSGVESAVYQATCSPFRNPLSARERRAMRVAASGPVARVTRTLARLAGVDAPEIRWRYVQEPAFDNVLGTLRIEGRGASLSIERSIPGDVERPRLEPVLERRLA